MAYSYENELNNLKTAQKNAAIADLENTRNTTLSDLQSESQKNALNAANQRNTANVQNRLSAKNFQEYLASTGRANSGISAQARLQGNNNLNTQLNTINGAENATNADIARRTTLANNAYNTGIASANANIESNYITNLLEQRAKAEQMAQQEREFNESVRQFNEQMALERQKMYSNFSSGGGRNYSSITTSNDQNNQIDWGTDNQPEKTVADSKTTKTLNNQKWNGQIGEITAKDGKGKMNVQLYKNGNNYYYKSGKQWILYA